MSQVGGNVSMLRQVDLDDFEKPVYFRKVHTIVFHSESRHGPFLLGFLPYGEFIYKFGAPPDVFFRKIPIEEVYYEPYRTFIRLKRPVDIVVYKGGGVSKLVVEGTEKILLNWSNWHRLKNLAKNKFRDVPTDIGVYQIRCVSPSGEPIKIHRAAGIDDEGILYIGAAWKRNIRSRVRAFWGIIARGRVRGHSGALTYVRYQFDRLYPKEMLEVRWAVVENPRDIERILLEEYMEKYLDTPPLNLSVGRKTAKE